MPVWRAQLLWLHNCLNCRKIINDHHLKTPKDFKEVIVNLLVYDDFAKDQYLVKLNWSAIYFSHLHGKLYTDSTNQSLISCSIRTWTSLKSRNLEKPFSKFCNISSIVLYILIFWFPLFKARKRSKNLFVIVLSFFNACSMRVPQIFHRLSVISLQFLSMKLSTERLNWLFFIAEFLNFNFTIERFVCRCVCFSK